MLGNTVNALVIVIGGIIGLIFNGLISKRYEEHITGILAIGVIVLGIQGAIKMNNPLSTFLAFAIGAILGEIIGIEEWLEKASIKLKNRFKIKSEQFSNAFISTTVLFCSGAMGIIGAIESGLHSNHSILFAKSVLDFIFSIIFASTMGIGVIFSSITTFLYQGIFVLSSQIIEPYLTDSIIQDISVTGSILIIGLGLNMLKLTKLKIANYIPAIFLAPILTILFKLLPM